MEDLSGKVDLRNIDLDQIQRVKYSIYDSITEEEVNRVESMFNKFPSFKINHSYTHKYYSISLKDLLPYLKKYYPEQFIKDNNFELVIDPCISSKTGSYNFDLEWEVFINGANFCYIADDYYPIKSNKLKGYLTEIIDDKKFKGIDVNKHINYFSDLILSCFIPLYKYNDSIELVIDGFIDKFGEDSDNLTSIGYKIFKDTLRVDYLRNYSVKTYLKPSDFNSVEDIIDKYFEGSVYFNKEGNFIDDTLNKLENKLDNLNLKDFEADYIYVDNTKMCVTFEAEQDLKYEDEPVYPELRDDIIRCMIEFLQANFLEELKTGNIDYIFKQIDTILFHDNYLIDKDILTDPYYLEKEHYLDVSMLAGLFKNKNVIVAPTFYTVIYLIFKKAGIDILPKLKKDYDMYISLKNNLILYKNVVGKKAIKTNIDKYNYEKLIYTVQAPNTFINYNSIYILNKTLNSEQISECLGCGCIKNYSNEIIELAKDIVYDEPLLFKEKRFNNVNIQSVRFYPEKINNRYRTPFKVYNYQVNLFNNLLDARILD